MSLLDDSTMDALTRSFLLGTGRQPAPLAAALEGLATVDGRPSELTLLALLGQRLRFRRHAPPPADSPTADVTDCRAIVPDAARLLMRRLLDGRDGAASGIAALALADVCNRRRLRPHPFDVPRLSAFIKAHGDQLGTYAAAWAARGEEANRGAGSTFDAEAIDPANWTTARPAARVGFIAALRVREPDQARTLIEASFAADPAPMRARLLGALACGLSSADQPFLESLATDRAPSVRDEAQRLLASIPGTAASEARLRDLVARTTRSTTGLVRRRPMLALERPAAPALPHAVAPESGRRWAAETYAGLGLDAMAAAFGLTVPGMIAAAADDAALTAVFARQASLERRFDVLAAIVREHAADAWIDAIGAGRAADLGGDAMIDGWCAAAIAPDLWPAMPAAAELERLYGFLRRPLPEPQAGALLRSRAFASLCGAALPPEAVGAACLALGALVPSALRSGLRTALAALPSEAASRPILLLDCLALLDPASLSPEGPAS